jgi:hypothetical protein
MLGKLESTDADLAWDLLKFTRQQIQTFLYSTAFVFKEEVGVGYKLSQVSTVSAGQVTQRRPIAPGRKYEPACLPC